MPGKFSFFCHKTDSGKAWFDENESKHAMLILRYREGDRISFTNGIGSRFEGTIISGNKQEMVAEILEEIQDEDPPFLTIVAGIIKSSDRMEWMVEKCTELGAKAVYFVNTANAERSKLNEDKLRRTAIAALKQCHGCWLPHIAQMSWKEVLQLPGYRCIASLQPDTRPLSPLPNSTESICLVGPEGDFTEAEIQEALHAGFVPVSLGKRILRTETAVVAAAAVFAVR